MDNLRFAANAYWKRGWLPIPLGQDANGYPKRPLTKDWTNLQRDPQIIVKQPWGNAVGIGIVLGPKSGNLAVIDVDDEELGREVFAVVLCEREETYMTWTARGRLHVYVEEQKPSRTKTLRYIYYGRPVAVELRAEGGQVAAPPSPGYSVANEPQPDGGSPWPDFTIQACWGRIACHSALTVAPEQATLGEAGYPRPWQPEVGEGERNNAAYIEAHKLREAGLELEQALEMMKGRLRQYAPGLEWLEVERTVRSAYRKPLPPVPTYDGRPPELALP